MNKDITNIEQSAREKIIKKKIFFQKKKKSKRDNNGNRCEKNIENEKENVWKKRENTKNKRLF